MFIGHYGLAFAALAVLLAAACVASLLGPPPPSVEAVVGSALVGYLIVAWAWWIDRHREPTGAFA